MSKAERYIELVSDENGHLCDQHALKAVEIAREEMIEEVCEFLDNNLCCYIKAQDFAIEHQRLKNDLKQAMKNEREQQKKRRNG